MKKPFITRKNLIALAIAALYGSLFVLVALSLIATKDSVISPNNIFLAIAKSFGFVQLQISGVNAVVSIVFTAVYLVVMTFGIIYVNRYQRVNRMKWHNWKILLAYFLVVVLSIGLSVGFTYILNLNNISSAVVVLRLVSQSLIITTLVGLGLAVVVTAICFLFVNFKKVDKPYVFFETEYFSDLGEGEGEDDGDSSVLNSFDSSTGDSAVNANGTVNGTGAGTGTIEDGGARELDDREKVFPGLSKVDLKYDGYAIESIQSDDIALPELLTRFRNYLAKVEGLYYDINTLRIYIAGMNATRLSILEGLSGTGKSSLPRYFAKFINAEVVFLPVQVTWRDKTSILGYFNDFAKIYNETDFLLGLYEAAYNQDKIHVFVLDEMNISRIEYYFADFLSVLEYPSDQWKIRLMQLPHGFVPPAKLEDGYIKIPENTFFTGTANKDDSTFSIADKVYDRSTVIAFDNRNDEFEVKGDYQPITLSYSKLKSLFDGAMKDEANRMTSLDYEKLNKVTSYIYDQFEVAFGNRVINQIEHLVPVFVASGGKKEDALDFIIARKVLIKLEGRFEEYVKPALKTLLELIDSTYGAKEFPLSRKSIESLMRKL